MFYNIFENTISLNIVLVSLMLLTCYLDDPVIRPALNKKSSLSPLVGFYKTMIIEIPIEGGRSRLLWP